MYLDADIFLTESNLLNYLIETKDWDWVIKAPMLKSPRVYSNFWGAQNSETGWYERSNDYEPIYDREDKDGNPVKGLYYVPVIHSCIFINLMKQQSLKVQFYPEMPNYPYPDIDEVLIMNYNFQQALEGGHPVIDNRYLYGFISLNLPDDEDDDYYQLQHILSEIMIEQPVGINKIIKPTLPVEHVYPTTLNNFGFDAIYCINLKRRPDRRARMEETFKLYGIGPVIYPGAVDGHKITQEWLDENGIAPLAGFVDPYHGRTLTKGEIGCFLSHWRLWMHAVKHGYKNMDDLRQFWGGRILFGCP